MKDKRITARDFKGRAYVPGYAPRCLDPQTCELLIRLTERLAEIEDEKEKEEERKSNECSCECERDDGGDPH